MQRTLEFLAELEADYGAYTHDSMTVYIAGRGGMEHCGATITSMSALGHEITHSWFARGVMPAMATQAGLTKVQLDGEIMHILLLRVLPQEHR